MSFFKENRLSDFAKLEYKSSSHTFNKAVIAAYYNVKKYGFEQYDWGFLIKQSKRTVKFMFDQNAVIFIEDPKSLYLSEHAIFKKKTKEVCYDLKKLFSERSTAIKRGISFTDRPQVRINDYAYGMSVPLVYEEWKRTKEEDPKTFLMTFNPARYLRSYELLDAGFDIYQKLITINDTAYALINFSKQGEYAYELSFLSLFKNKELKLINDQNDCIIINCLYDLYKNHGIKYVNLGTDAGIKGLKFFKHKLPNFETIVYSS